MQLPKQLKICGLTYEVMEEEFDEMASVSHINQKIRIRGGIKPDNKEESLLHEILHICFDRSGLWLRMKNDKILITEEEVIGSISPLLYSALAENKIDFTGE
jgi:hypothetical protein